MSPAIARVLELHEPTSDLDAAECIECGHAWPCATVTVLVEEAAS